MYKGKGYEVFIINRVIYKRDFASNITRVDLLYW